MRLINFKPPHLVDYGTATEVPAPHQATGSILVADDAIDYDSSGNLYPAYKLDIGRYVYDSVTDIATVKEQALNQVDADCSAYILSYWSLHAQTNVSNGLYSQDICELCKTEISAVLAENKGYIDDIELLNTIQEIEDFVATITRIPITGAQ